MYNAPVELRKAPALRLAAAGDAGPSHAVVGRRNIWVVHTQLAIESTVVLAFSSLAAAAITAALGYLREREWPAVVFLLVAAMSTISYGMIFMTIVRAVYARG